MNQRTWQVYPHPNPGFGFEILDTNLMDGTHEDAGIVARNVMSLVDAHLLAAAPELLTALRKARDIYRWMTGSPDFLPEGQAFEGWQRFQADRDFIDAVIVKAEGRELVSLQEEIDRS